MIATKIRGSLARGLLIQQTRSSNSLTFSYSSGDKNCVSTRYTRFAGSLFALSFNISILLSSVLAHGLNHPLISVLAARQRRQEKYNTGDRREQDRRQRMKKAASEAAGREVEIIRRFLQAFLRISKTDPIAFWLGLWGCLIGSIALILALARLLRL